MNIHVNDVRRIYNNISVLLHAGLFPGQLSGELTEARKFIEDFVGTLPADPVASEAPTDGGQV